jgi:NUDIX domain.
MSDNQTLDPEQIERQYAAALLVTESGEVVGAFSNSDTATDRTISTFDGKVREDDGTPVETIWRELQDSLGIEIDPGDIVPLRSEMVQGTQDEQWEMYHYFYVTIPDEALDRLAIREGQDWQRITGTDDPLIPVRLRSVVDEIYQKLELGIFE